MFRLVKDMSFRITSVLTALAALLIINISFVIMSLIDGARSVPLTSIQLTDRWPVPKLGVNGEFDGESITYLGPEQLLVADAYAESIWSIATDTGLVTSWLESPSFGMFPFEIRYEPMNDVVFVASLAGASSKAGLLPSQYLILGRDASLRSRWRIRDTDDAWITHGAAKRIAVSPKSLVAWITWPPPSPTSGQGSRISTASLDGQRWSGGRCLEAYDSLAVDAADQYYLQRALSLQRGEGGVQVPGYRIDRSDRNCRQPDLFFQYDGRQPYWGAGIAMSSWPTPDRVYVANELLVTAFDMSADRLFTSFVPQLCPACPIYSLATRSDSEFAVLARNKPGSVSPSDEKEHMAQVVQFDREGTPRVRTVFRAPDVPVVWPSGRMVVDKDDRVHVLYPDSDMVATFTPTGAIERTTAVVSWASDLAVSGNLLAIKGSSGDKGAIQVIGTDGGRQWQVSCDCDASAAVSFTGDRVVTGNTLTARLDSFRQLDGARQSPMQQQPQGAFLPLDLAATDSEIYVLNGASTGIEVYDNTSAGSGPQRYIATPDDAFRIDVARNGTLAVLTRSGDLVVVAPDVSSTQEIQLSSMRGVEDTLPIDVAWAPSGELFILDARRPSVFRLRLMNVPPTVVVPTPAVSDDPGECSVTGDKRARPGLVTVSDTVQINLQLAIDCLSSPRPPLDVMLVLSGWFMRAGNGSEARDYHSAMLQAAERLANALDLSRDRVAVYQIAYGQHLNFSADPIQIRSAIRRVGNYYDPFLPPDMNSYSGLGWALSFLADRARPGADRVLVQIADTGGMYIYNEPDLVARARAASVRTILVYRPWDGGLPAEHAGRLQNMVDAPEDLLSLDDVLASDALLQRVVEPYRSSPVRDIEIWDTVGRDMRLVPNSSNPLAQERSDTVVWRSSSMPKAGISMTLRVQPVRTGLLPTNTQAVAYFTDSGGIRRRYTFPRPLVEVIAPTPTATVTSRPTETETPRPTEIATLLPTATEIPGAVYLPLLLREKCVPEQQRMDVVLVIDASTSMLDRTAANRTKLDAARAAAVAFLARLRLGTGDQASAVVFNSEAMLLQELTDERAALENALDRITVAPQTCIVCGVEVARLELGSQRRIAGNRGVIILLTDGRSNPQPISSAVAAAIAAKMEGVAIFTIGLGEEAEKEGLTAMASKPEWYYPVPDAEVLAEIYTEIAVAIPCPHDAFWGRR